MQDADIVLRVLSAAESGRTDELQALHHPDIAFHWQPGLPCGGDHAGPDVPVMAESFAAVWGPLQPDRETRAMHPNMVAAENGHVIASYSSRVVDRQGRGYETDTLAHYQITDSRLRNAQMFYYDLVGLPAFRDDARR